MTRRPFDQGMVVIVMVLVAITFHRLTLPPPIARPVPAPIVAPVQAAEIEPVIARTDQLVTFARRWEVATTQEIILPPKSQVRYLDTATEGAQPAAARERVEVVSDEVSVATVDPLPPRRHRVVQRIRNARADVCTRHKMRKVYVRGGRSWRCRR